VTQHSRDTPQFYLTAPSACPYLPGREERKVFTHLVGERAAELNNILTQGGFRRSQSIAYRPACEGCRSCVSVRVIAHEFRPSRSMRRIDKRNADIVGEMRTAVPSSEQYSVFRAYLDSRHRDGGMADMTVLDYAMMVEDSHVDTRIIEYRRVAFPHDVEEEEDRHGRGGRLDRSRRNTPARPSASAALRTVGARNVRGSRSTGGDLVAVALTDVLGDGLSMVYSFFEPDESARSLGTFMVLDHIARAQAMGLAYVYLGYWVRGSGKMDYKSRFLPQERLTPDGWMRAE
jgi:arginine-tRNA-protein transferase